jgi:flagellar biogenesis protein FliO
MIKLVDLLKQLLEEDRCKRIADRKYDKPSAYKSGAIVRCRKGDIWKDIKEGSEEEAWEFVLSPDPNIKKVVQQANLSDKEEDIKKITSIIDNTKTTAISSSQIVKLKNFNNKPGEESLIDDMTSVSKSQNPRQSYTDYMKKRDEREGRNRGYDPVQNFDNVVKGSYEPPVLIKVNGTLYVIGGRTRLYAGLAANKSMNVKIIDISQLKEADDPQAGKAAPYGSGYAKVKQAIQELLQEDETLHKWFSRKGAKGKSKGWVDCNAPDGKGGYKSCGRQEGEKRSKYPSCRPTPAQCKTPGKGKKWGKTK